jgi:hypothetical protein
MRTTTNTHDFKIGDILYTSWGYDQTNIDFYQVVKITKATIGVRRIASDLTVTGIMCGYVTARPNEFIHDEVWTKRPDRHGHVRIASYAAAIKWDGLPKYCSWYA